MPTQCKGRSTAVRDREAGLKARLYGSLRHALLTNFVSMFARLSKPSNAALSTDLQIGLFAARPVSSSPGPSARR